MVFFQSKAAAGFLSLYSCARHRGWLGAEEVIVLKWGSEEGKVRGAACGGGGPRAAPPERRRLESQVGLGVSERVPLAVPKATGGRESWSSERPTPPQEHGLYLESGGELWGDKAGDDLSLLLILFLGLQGYLFSTSPRTIHHFLYSSSSSI